MSLMTQGNDDPTKENRDRRTTKKTEIIGRTAGYVILGMGALIGAVIGAKSNVLVAGIHGREHVEEAKAAERCAAFVTSRGSRIVLDYSSLTRQQTEDCGVDRLRDTYSMNTPPASYEGPVYSPGIVVLPSVGHSNERRREALASIGGVGILEGVESSVVGGGVGLLAVGAILQKVVGRPKEV